MNKLMKGISVVSISVPDVVAAKAFYQDMLGLGEPTYDLPEANWIEFRTGNDAGLSLTKLEEGVQQSTSTTVVLNVDDCFEAVRELRNRGVRCDDPQVFPGFVTFANIYDPFGNRLQICSDG